MKGFLIFLAVTFMIMGAIGYYEMQHPDEIHVRQNGHWVTLKRVNETQNHPDNNKASTP